MKIQTLTALVWPLTLINSRKLSRAPEGLKRSSFHVYFISCPFWVSIWVQQERTSPTVPTLVLKVSCALAVSRAFIEFDLLKNFHYSTEFLNLWFNLAWNSLEEFESTRILHTIDESSYIVLSLPFCPLSGALIDSCVLSKMSCRLSLTLVPVLTGE